jgi:hypothetical protein
MECSSHGGKQLSKSSDFTDYPHLVLWMMIGYALRKTNFGNLNKEKKAK